MSYAPFNYIAPVMGASGSTSGAIGNAPVAGMYGVVISLETASAVSLSTATVVVTHTSGGVARQATGFQISLGSASSSQGNLVTVNCDAGTTIGYSITAVGTGTYNLRAGSKFLTS